MAVSLCAWQRPAYQAQYSEVSNTLYLEPPPYQHGVQSLPINLAHASAPETLAFQVVGKAGKVCE